VRSACRAFHRLPLHARYLRKHEANDINDPTVDTTRWRERRKRERKRERGERERERDRCLREEDPRDEKDESFMKRFRELTWL